MALHRAHIMIGLISEHHTSSSESQQTLLTRLVLILPVAFQAPQFIERVSLTNVGLFEVAWR